MQRPVEVLDHHVIGVSILIQPEGRMQPVVSRSPRPSRRRFNPHPARRPDATGGQRHYHHPCHVSILIQPEGRMQHPLLRADPGRVGRFNPHPARRPDATRRRPLSSSQQASFQSSSSQKAGCNPPAAWPIWCRRIIRFNPHPARRPDATEAPAWVKANLRVSILIQPEGRMQPLPKSL